MKLYSYWRSSCSWRVRLALGAKGILTEIIPIHLVQNGGEQFSVSYSSKNSMHQVPTLELDDGSLLTQSIAIIEYLEEKYPTPSLFPADPFLRAKTRELVEIINSGIQPLQNLSLLLTLEALKPNTKRSWGKQVIEKGLIAVEEISRATSGIFLMGDQFSIADCCLIPQLYNARRFGCDLSAFPNLISIEQNCKKLAFFAAATPEQQIDAQ